MKLFAGLLCLWFCAGPVQGHGIPDAIVAPMRAADVVFLGEVHDNPAHHAIQADIVEHIAPTALVFEMFPPEAAQGLSAELVRDADALARALDWDAGGWPDFSMYHPIFLAAPGAAILGAGLPRDGARAALRNGVVAAFGVADAARFGLDQPLDMAEQAAREAEQSSAHCDALPVDLLSSMVAVQRLRDAMLARAALDALRAHGGPVVVITGNGHARRDGGAPAALALAAPDVRIDALGQAEGGVAPDGVFDTLSDARPVERPDPCAQLR